MNITSKRFSLWGAQPRILRMRLNSREAKPNGSNQKVSFQFVLKKHRQQDTQRIGALQAEFQFVIFAEKVQRAEVQSESLTVG